MDEALVIGGTGAQGRRWVDNLRNEGFEVKVVGSNYENKLQTNTRYDIMVISVPHYAFLPVLEFLAKNNIITKYLILEKPGASTLKEYIQVTEYAERISNYRYMFLPVLTQYRNINPKNVTYINSLDLSSIIEINKQKETIIVRYGNKNRQIDSNVLRDLLFHPLSFYSDFTFMITKIYPNDEVYKKYELGDEKGNKITVGRDPKYSERTYDSKQIIFGNPMETMIKDINKENGEGSKILELENYPYNIWMNLDKILENTKNVWNNWDYI